MNTCIRETRQPKQARGRQTAERILDAARRLFCEKGYYDTTTNEIARTAGISIGSLYTYFSDKDTILAVLLEQHNRQFGVVLTELKAELDRRHGRENLREWLRSLVVRMVDMHRSVADFDRLLRQLYFAKPEAAAAVDGQTEMVRRALADFLLQGRDGAEAEDVWAAAAVMVDFVNVLVNRIAFGESGGQEERILAVGVDMLCAACCFGEFDRA